MYMHVRCWLTLSVLSLFVILQSAKADEFVSIDWDRLRVDSVLPFYTHSFPLPQDYMSYDYDIRLEYPEFEKVSQKEAVQLARLEGVPEGMPVVRTSVETVSKQGILYAELVPVVWREGTFQRLVSVKFTIVRKRKPAVAAMVGTSEEEGRYIASSVLSQGRWVKIRISESGVYRITHKELSSMGFNRPEKVRLYGQGGRMLSENKIQHCVDDLKEVPIFRRNSDFLFYARGTVKWARDGSSFVHSQNTYSRHGYYFLTENDSTPPMEFIQAQAVEGGKEVKTFTDYALYENDAFHWIERGRQFFENYDYKNGRTKSYIFDLPGVTAEGYSMVKVAFGSDDSSGSTVAVSVNGEACGKMDVPFLNVSKNSYTRFRTNVKTLTTTGKLLPQTNITLTHTSPSVSSGRLDYIVVNYTRELALNGAYTCFRSNASGKQTFSISAADANTRVWKISDGGAAGDIYTELSGVYADNIYKVGDNASLTDEYVVFDAIATGYPSVEVVGEVPNQNLHGLSATDMVIVVPSSATWLSQAERLAELHRNYDSLRVVVVRADQIYNEFSSGMPDATAIRRFLKMFYDRAKVDADLPKYLLLFADCASDNRMISAAWRNSSPDDYLPCFQSENSYSETTSFVMEEYFCLLDDDEGSEWRVARADAAVGRLTVHSLAEAKTVVDKIEAYMSGRDAGVWRSRVCMLGDDGDENGHMKDADWVAEQIQESNPDMMIEKVYWDCFTVEKSSSGLRYPAVTQRMRDILAEGTLMMNYSGHGRADELSHELAWGSAEMAALTSPRLPLWVMAGCDIGPIDLPEDNMSEIALLNEKGGAVAVLGTTRSTFRDKSNLLNKAFCKYLFAERLPMGEALRRAKNETISSVSENHLHFVLIGDPALRLATPDDYQVKVTEIDGYAVAEGGDVALPKFKAGAQVTLKGVVVDAFGNRMDGFNGLLFPTLYDRREKVVCLGNAVVDELFEFWDYPRKLYAGRDSVRNGEFTFTFPIPLDISYSDDNGALFLYAINDAREEAQGSFTDFIIGGTEEGLVNDSVGPEINVWFNTTDFLPGGSTNETPLLMLALHDEDGINTTGIGVGHDLIAIVDNDPQMTYVLNSYYASDAGDYTRGSVTFSMPELAEGEHTLMVRAWDVMNNSSTVEVPFSVVKGLRPLMTDVWCTDSPARTSTTFVVTHDRPQTALDVKIEVFDFAGRILWEHTESGTSSGNESRVIWNLDTTSGQPIGNGVYLYRATISSAGGSESSKTRKILVGRQ
ncbi:MAG: type IX secretion system sortase PorU [Bacteroidaceae bacterium]|nr:type IX secretion system sortase PorU [Bacteroidaceae bacterium]